MVEEAKAVENMVVDTKTVAANGRNIASEEVVSICCTRRRIVEHIYISFSRQDTTPSGNELISSMHPF
jgi:hypothetical protein